jgi:NAD(P)H-hydrate epimerase
VRALAATDVPIVAADVPSGVDASTGEVSGPAVTATATATFHAAKPGLWIAPGKHHAGAVHVIAIGIPDGAPVTAQTFLIGEAVTELAPKRVSDSTKFSSGHVLVCGGSLGLTGAPSMAAEAAMRAGAGYVSACIPRSLNLVFETRLLEVMTIPLPDEDGTLTPAGADTVLAEAERRGGALIVGPGFGRSDGAVELARTLAARAPVALVLDADGLNAHAGRLEALRERTAPTVLTPHAGELGRLLEIDSAAVGERRLHHAREAARRSGAIVVLKGDDTLVAEPEGRVAVSPGGAGALATAGTGDVLSGVTAAMLARIEDPFAAVCAAVELHRRAGRQAAADVGAAEGVIASDVIAALPRASRM